MLTPNRRPRPLMRQVARLAAGIFAAVLILASPMLPVQAQTSRAQSAEIWNSFKADIFGARPIEMAELGALQVIAPKRAQDAGLVPVDIQFNPGAAKDKIVAVTLIVDVNPSPLAAVFRIGEGSGVSRISLRLRVNDYSVVRAIAETAGGKLLMAETYVKATGGCSAPAVRNPQEAKATMGVMKLRQFPPEAGAPANGKRELQLMIRHPNHSGFQMDQLTRYYIPPHFINKVNLSQDGLTILSMEGGISISEDPNFRFDYLIRSASPLKAEAVDTEGNVFSSEWPLEAAGL